ncbi:S41 family peptidase [Candidatus Pseudothioglobus singularis]|nr:S41 family peptidase [Candidatus Pseudothioglobus singularis]MDA9801180.1 S41 family peptidase [Candidatus Pseudothioglobus singularis]MDB4822780.1 S41 family peptidase [Candidatus Pseudothioglobus singularis]MDC0596332.1 S41 family peptidase [Candidatus Pseudothioglobus singularis]
MINLKSFFQSFTLSIFILFAASSAADEDNYSPLDSPSFFEGLNTFTAVFSQIKQMYVDDIDDETLFNNAIRGLIEGLDPHSSFLEPVAQSKVSESTMGKFGGLGIVIGTKGDFIEVVSPIDDTPAYRAGLKAGDIILQIGDQNVSQINLEEGVKLMRGAPGTSIKLTIGRPDIAPFVVEITREVITITSAKGLLVSDGIGYLRIAQFQRPTAEVVEKIIANLVRKNEGDLDSLIIDLRNNPGGLLDSSIDISNLFIDEPGIVVYTEGRTPTSNMSFPTKPGDILNGAPIVVLMNVGSASASEIVAGALQDHKRAIIMGEESFGKGSVQSMMSLQDGYGLKLTTARYFTPSGRSIQAKGISPDIELDNISLKDDEDEDSIDFSSQEKDLKNALSAQDEDETKPDDSSDSKSDSTDVDTSGSQDEVNPTELTAEEILESQDKIAAERDQEYIDLLLEDYYVHEAVNVLKALQIYNK